MTAAEVVQQLVTAWVAGVALALMVDLSRGRMS